VGIFDKIKNTMRMTGPFWVYTHTTPDGMVYVGRSGMKNTFCRWQPASYNKTSLQPYIEKWGWENIKHEVVKDNLSKEESYRLEDELIQIYKGKGVCINTYFSGDIEIKKERKRERKKQYREEHKEELVEYNKIYYEQNKERELDRNREWRERNKSKYTEYCRKHNKEYYEKNKEKLNEYMRQYRQRKKLLSQVQPDGCISLW
jgi:hypothetical protein